MWAVTNSRVTAVSWSLQMVFVMVQAGFVNENLQVLIKNVVVVETLRAQVNRIVEVLSSVLVAKLMDMEDHIASQGTEKVEDFNVAQHMSAACRVARKPILCNLVASKVLMLINDHDVAMCRDARMTRIGFCTKMAIALPTFLALSHESVQQCFLDVLIPSVWCCFVLANAMLWQVSPWLVFAPYVFLILVAVTRYGYVLPQRQRRGQHHQLTSEQRRASYASEAQPDSEENMWRNMNLCLELTCHEAFLPSAAQEFSFLRSESAATLRLPAEISAQRARAAVASEEQGLGQGGASGFLFERHMSGETSEWGMDSDASFSSSEDENENGGGTLARQTSAAAARDQEDLGELHDYWSVVFAQAGAEASSPASPPRRGKKHSVIDKSMSETLML
jgi:hypothetical protein